MSGILLVRLRSDVNVTKRVRDTLGYLNLTRVNHATIVPDTPEYHGMVNKVRDHITFGTVDAQTVEKLLTERGRAQGDEPITDKVLADCSDYKTVADYAAALAEGKTRLGIRRLAEGSKTRREWAVKPVLRLAPPKKGHEGIKHAFNSGGALGDRGDQIGRLVERMV